MAISNALEGGRVSGPSVLETYSGLGVDLLLPDPETLTLEDVAVALGNTCRFGGHVRRFYSVAEHSVLVARLIPHLPAASGWHSSEETYLQKAALFHDASEAYLGDVPSPLKWTMRYGGQLQLPSAYDDLSERMDQAVCSAFGILERDLTSDHVKLADLWALRIESGPLTHSGGRGWRWPEEVVALGGLPVGVPWRCGMPPLEAAHHFITVYSVMCDPNRDLPWEQVAPF